jgi:lysyl-tRNA synthetase class 2
VVLAGLLLVGLPLDYDDESGSLAVVLALAAVQLAICTVTFLKGKIILGLVGLFIPVAAYVGAIRLARPESPWARWRYKGNEKKMARAIERSAKVDRRRTRLLDMVGGAPSAGGPSGADQ